MTQAMKFVKATREKLRARVAFIGPAGSGKSYSAYAVAAELGRFAVICTERGSARKYAGRFDFDVLEIESFSPETYVQAIDLAGREGYDALVIDSLSHAWMGKDGALEQVDRAAKKSSSGNTFVAWRDVTPMHNRLVDAMLGCPCHLIVTMRSKTEWVLEEGKNGKKTPRKVGLAPIQRDGVEFEFDVVGDFDSDHNLTISKTRCETLDGACINKPGREFAETLRTWLEAGEAPRPKQAPKTKPAAVPSGPTFSRKWMPREWGGKRIESAPSSVISDYIDYLCANIDAGMLSDEHTRLARASLEEAQEICLCVRAEEELKRASNATTDDINAGLEAAVGTVPQDGNESWGLTPP